MSAIGIHRPYEECMNRARYYAKSGDVFGMASELRGASKMATLTNSDSQGAFDLYWAEGIFKEFSEEALFCPSNNLKTILSCLDSTKDWRDLLFKEHIKEYLGVVETN